MKPILLVVDDAAVDRELVGGLLKQHPEFDVEFAWDGDDAMQPLSESRVDVVVTDLMMPDMDGLELVEAMRSNVDDITFNEAANEVTLSTAAVA